MRKLILNYILFISIIGNNPFFCQNWIKNSSFEEYSICPETSGQIEYSIDWINPTNGSPDYFNSCSSTFGVPSYCNCSDVFQYAKSGGAYCGIWAYSPQFENIREYIQTGLRDSLKFDKCYHLSMYVNSANWSAYAISGLGFHLSNNPIYATGNGFLLNYEPQVFLQDVIYDTLNWIQIHGILKANGNEKFLTIGNFFSDNDIVIEQHPNVLPTQAAYYLIDDVSLFQLGDGYAGKDTTILIGNSVYLGQNVENLPSTWSILGGAEIATNVSGVLVAPIVTTTYVCEQNFCGEVMYDTVTVAVYDNVGLQSEEENEKIRIFPNPSDGSFELSTVSNETLEFELKNALGQLVYRDSIKNGSKKVVLKLEKGIYFISFGNHSRSQKIIIQ